MRYDERSTFTGLRTKLVDGGRYAKYHPNTMLSMFHSMSDVHPAGAAPSSGVEESKFEDSDEPSAKELRDYRLRFPNRQPFLNDAPKIISPLRHALHDAALNEALDTSRAESQLSHLDADRERELIFGSQLAEAPVRPMVPRLRLTHFRRTRLLFRRVSRIWFKITSRLLKYFAIVIMASSF